MENTKEEVNTAYPLTDELQLAHKVCAFLNEVLLLDREAVASLINDRVPCNRELADHPSVQVGAAHGGFNVGMLGIINGLVGVRPNKYGYIAAIYEDRKQDNLLHFEVLIDEQQDEREVL